MTSNDPVKFNPHQRRDSVESLKILDKLEYEDTLIFDDRKDFGYVDTEKYFNQETNLIFKAKTNSLVRKIHKIKKKLLKDVKQYPEEMEKVKEITKKQQKLKEEYPLIFIDKDEDIKNINLFKKCSQNKINSEAKTNCPLKKISSYIPNISNNQNGIVENDLKLNISQNNNFILLTPFQRMENKNSFQKYLIKEKVLNMHNKKYDFNINNTNLIKNIKIENLNNLENELIKNLNDTKNLKIIGTNENEDNLYSLKNMPTSISLKRYLSNKEKINKNNIKVLSNNEVNNNLKVKKLDNDLIVISDLYIENLIKKRDSNYDRKSKTPNLIGNEKNNYKVKSQATENTQWYFFNKNSISNSESKNYFKYKKRLRQIKPVSSIISNYFKKPDVSNLSLVNPEKKDVYIKEKISKGKNDINKEIIITRKHSSVQCRDLSDQVHIIKVDRILLDKMKNF